MVQSGPCILMTLRFYKSWAVWRETYSPADLGGGNTAAMRVALQAAQATFFSELFPEVLSFAGAVMVRRILGIAHVVDFEHIADADIRHGGALCCSLSDLGLCSPDHLL